MYWRADTIPRNDEPLFKLVLGLCLGVDQQQPMCCFLPNSVLNSLHKAPRIIRVIVLVDWCRCKHLRMFFSAFIKLQDYKELWEYSPIFQILAADCWLLYGDIGLKFRFKKFTVCKKCGAEIHIIIFTKELAKYLGYDWSILLLWIVGTIATWGTQPGLTPKLIY